VNRATNGDSMQSKAGETGARAWSPRRLWPLLVIALALVLFFAFGLQRYISLAALTEHQAEWRDFIQDHLLAAMLVYIALYTAVVALSIPIAVLLTLIGGFLFGAALTFPMVVSSATLGATLIFLAARTALGGLLEAKAGPWFSRLEQGFRRDRWSYMLFLRLTPLVPFFIVNLAPAFLGVDLLCFVVTTFFGIMPVTLIFVLAGSGIGEVLDSGSFTIGSVLSPKLIIALTGLGLVAILPALLRRFRKKLP
jgi:uncharacterized membrane protein YdjX (TVP38/TMEM64 family)